MSTTRAACRGHESFSGRGRLALVPGRRPPAVLPQEVRGLARVTRVVMLPAVLALLAGVQCSDAIDLIATGEGWSKTFGANDLAGGAGADIAMPYETASGVLTLDIVNTGGAAWTVKVRRTDTNWRPGDFTLSVRRSGTGGGPGTLSGDGSTYQAITTTDVAFFHGTGDRTTIPLQFRLQGVSVRIPVDSYATTVTYTVLSP